MCWNLTSECILHNLKYLEIRKWTPCFPLSSRLKSYLNLLPMDSFGIYSSSGFQNTPYMLMLMSILHQIQHSGTVLESSWKADSKTVELRYRAIQTLNNFPSGYAIDSMQHAMKHTLRCGNGLCKLQNLAYKIQYQ